MSGFSVVQGDCRLAMGAMAPQSVHCCVTSPPYWGLRDYGVAGQLGLEQTPEEYVAAMVEVFREVRRVLRDDGTLWLNLGDSYAGGGTIGRNDTTPEALARRAATYGTGTGSGSAVGSQGSRPAVEGMKPKDLVGIPWAVAFALRADGWYLRSDIIWSKPNPMPESVTDRPTKAHEYIFLLSKSERYYYDAAACAEASTTDPGKKWTDGGSEKQRGHGRRHAGFNGRYAERLLTEGGPSTRNRRSVWHVATKPFKGAHFATFPPALIEPCILAGCPAGGTVLDPFTGSGTTGEVAIRHGRNFVGCELNPDYAEMARKRIGDAPRSLFDGAA